MADLQELKNSRETEKSEADLALERDTVGIIDRQAADLIGLPKAGAVILKEEDIKHIETRHGEQIKNAEFNSVRDFVTYVLSHIDAVYEGSNEAYAFIAQGVKHNDRVLTILEITEGGTGSDIYTIKTAHPINRKFYKNKTPLWERAQLSHSYEGGPRAVSDQSGENDVLFPGNAPNNRLHKGTPLGVNSGGNKNIQLNFTANLPNVKGTSEQFQNQHLKNKHNFQEQLQNDLKKLEGEYQNFLKARQERIPGLEKAHERNTRRIEAFANAIELRDKTRGLEPVLYVNGYLYGVKDETKFAKEVLAPAARKSARNNWPQAIGKYRGFDVMVQGLEHRHGAHFFIRNSGEYYTTPELRYEGKDSFKLADFSKRLDNFMEHFEIKQKNALLKGIRLDGKLKEAWGGQGFPKMEMLKALRSDNREALLELRKIQKDPTYKSSWEPKSWKLTADQEQKQNAPEQQEKETPKQKDKCFGR